MMTQPVWTVHDRPFRHLVVDGLLPKALTKRAVAEFPSPDDPGWYREASKRQIKWSWKRMDTLQGGAIADIQAVMSRPAAMDALREHLGIDEPVELGIGNALHMIPPGGFLGAHVDFNFHPRDKGLHRRVNALIYLNDPWCTAWGGEIRFYDHATMRCDAAYSPIAGRMVAFETTETSFHGHPEPLACPDGEYRRSIAFYYYSRNRPAHQIAAPHNTIYREVASERSKA